MELESDFTAFENLVSEHSIPGVPASLYNLTKSVPEAVFWDVRHGPAQSSNDCTLHGQSHLIDYEK